MNKSESVVTRFAPSPTGYLHIGGARTALFNWLFARKNKGKFILRIEDTDRQRSKQEYVEDIIEALSWLGLYWDEGPIFQSQRLDYYNSIIEKLLKEGKAYYCHCDPEELEKKKKEAMARGEKPRYDRKCRDLGLGPAPGAVVRIKAPLTGITQFKDIIKGNISVPNEELDDIIIRRSDGTPTFHLAVVADDIDMGINYIIRGDDHLNNTPKQIIIYQALNAPIPKYAHIPLILGPDRARLSKRHGAMPVLAYKEMGYLPQALVNALARLGWSYGNQERFTVEELIEKFSLERVGKSPGIFNAEKLLDLNAWHIRNSSDEYLAKELIPFIKKLGIQEVTEQDTIKLVPILKKRSKTLVEMAEKSLFYFGMDVEYEEDAEKNYLIPQVLALLSDLRDRISKIESFDQKSLEELFIKFLDDHKIKLKEIAQAIRVALTGKTVSPGLFEMMEVLGKEKVLYRLSRAIERIKRKGFSNMLK